MVELVDTADSKSFVLGRTGSNPVRSKNFNDPSPDYS